MTHDFFSVQRIEGDDEWRARFVVSLDSLDVSSSPLKHPQGHRSASTWLTHKAVRCARESPWTQTCESASLCDSPPTSRRPTLPRRRSSTLTPIQTQPTRKCDKQGSCDYDKSNVHLFFPAISIHIRVSTFHAHHHGRCSGVSGYNGPAGGRDAMDRRKDHRS
jgi:hypothetical protein